MHLQVKENVPQAKQAEKQVTNPAGAAKQADAKVKEAVPQAKQAENAATGKSGGFSFDLGGILGGNTADTAKNADSKVLMPAGSRPMEPAQQGALWQWCNTSNAVGSCCTCSGLPERSACWWAADDMDCQEHCLCSTCEEGAQAICTSLRVQIQGKASHSA